MKMNNQFLTEFINFISAQKSTSELKAFIQAILTPKEIEEIPKRLQIVKLLKQGMPQREIAQKLKVGVATVTRGSRELHKGSFKNVG